MRSGRYTHAGCILHGQPGWHSTPGERSTGVHSLPEGTGTAVSIEIEISAKRRIFLRDLLIIFMNIARVLASSYAFFQVFISFEFVNRVYTIGTLNGSERPKSQWPGASGTPEGIRTD